MKFNEYVLDKLKAVIQKNNLKVIEQHKDYVRLESVYLTIIISFNQLENACNLWIGRNGGNNNKVEIDNEVMSSFFHSTLKFSDVTTETFINNLVLFLMNEALPLLQGDLFKISELEQYDQNRSDKYTKRLIEKQYIAAADKAWDEKKYNEFIMNIDKVNKQDLPPSYEQKYRMAKKHSNLPNNPDNPK